MSTMEDKALALQARHAIARSPLDISQVMVNCSRGVLEVTGSVRRPRDYRGDLNMKQELLNIKRLLQGVRGVKDVIADRLRVME
jgi:hypothetical protein